MIQLFSLLHPHPTNLSTRFFFFNNDCERQNSRSRVGSTPAMIYTFVQYFHLVKNVRNINVRIINVQRDKHCNARLWFTRDITRSFVVLAQAKILYHLDSQE